MSNAHNRRRQMTVNRQLQSRIVFSVSWPPALALMITAVVVGLLCFRLSGEAMAANITLPSLLPLFLTVAAFLMVAAFYLVANAWRFSHRVAGPMYRLNKTLEQVQEGDLTVRANLRKGDFLVEVADGMNDFLEWLESHPPRYEAGEESADAAGGDAADVPVEGAERAD